MTDGSVRIEDIDPFSEIEDVAGFGAYREEVPRHLDQFAIHRFPLLDDSRRDHPNIWKKDLLGFAQNGDHEADRLPILLPLEHELIARSEDEVGICSPRHELAVLQSKVGGELGLLRHGDTTQRPE